VFILYNGANLDTFEAVHTHINTMEKYTKDSICKILLGNKCDLEESREVPKQRGKELAESYNMQFLETSVKTTQNVEEALMTLMRELMVRGAQPSECSERKA